MLIIDVAIIKSGYQSRECSIFRFGFVSFYFKWVNAIGPVQYGKLKYFFANNLYLLKFVVYLHPKQRGIEQ